MSNNNTISDNLIRLNSAKTAIANAIVDKGGTVNTGDGFEDFPDDINSIPTGSSSSFTLDNVNCKPSLKGEYSNSPIWEPTGITSQYTTSTSVSLGVGSIWTDGVHTYYATNSPNMHYEYLSSENMWTTRPSYNNGRDIVNGITYGFGVWTDGDNIYYTYVYKGISTYQRRILDKTTNTWKDKTWTWSGVSEPDVWNGSDTWTDGVNVYLSNSYGQYMLDKSTSTWTSKSWNIDISSEYIWTDDTDTYYSYTDNQYVLNKSTMQWETKTWNGLTSINGGNVWTDGENIYYSNSSDGNYVLNKSTSTWEVKTWGGLTSFNGGSVWTDGEDIYYINSGTYYKLNKNTEQWESITFTFNTGSSALYGDYTWYDGTNIYYSQGNIQQIFDKNNNIFLNTTWTGLTNFNGNCIWSDGTDIYYSSGTTHYVLDKFNKSWTTKTWYGLTNFTSGNIWSDGENIYYSASSTQYVLDKSTSTWEIKTWYGYTYISGNGIWNDGENICYTSGSSISTNTYILDISTSTWTLTSHIGIGGKYVWTDGEYIYLGPLVGSSSSSALEYPIYNKANNTYVTVKLGGERTFMPYGVWTDGNDIYYSTGSGWTTTPTIVYKLTKTKNKNPITISNPTTPNNRIPFNE